MKKSQKKPDNLDMKVRGYQEWAAFGFFIANLGEELAWHYGMEYTGLKLIKKENTWLIILTAHAKDGGKVAFYEAQTVVDAFRVVYAHLRRNQIVWRKDRYNG